MNLKQNKGAALIVTLFFAVILYSLSGMFALRVISEKNIASVTQASVGSFYAAQGGSEDDLRTYVEARYKMTVYRGQPYGELFDLQDDPEERRNLWDDPAQVEVKTQVMHRFLQAEMAREPTRMPRIAGA